MNSTQQAIFRAIAISSHSLPSIQVNDRQQAFQVLEDLKKYEGRIPLCLQWLGEERHLYENQDITTVTKLLSLEIISNFLQKNYSTISENDRLQLRDGILKAARLLANSQMNEETRILAKKLASIIEGLVIRDFPQRWTTFSSDIFSSQRNNGLWYNEPGSEAIHHLGVRISLECLRLVAEDCTNSDFNAKISTVRRNDVLIGLNEISGEFLPLLFQLLEHYPLLQQSKATLHNMHTYLLTNKRQIKNLNIDETAEYNVQALQKQNTAQMIADCLATLEKFCCSMPVSWMTGGGHDFVAALLHLMREPECQVQVRAVECIEQLTLRGKLEFSQWMRLITDIPHAVHEANQSIKAEQEQETARRAANGQTDPVPDALTMQYEFHRSLSRMLSNVIQSHIALINSHKGILTKQGTEYEHFIEFLKLLVDMLHHPSGRICTEQINMWAALLRDPQVTKSRILQPFAEDILTSFMDRMVKIRWEDVEEQTHPCSSLLEVSYDDEEDYETWMNDLRSRSSIIFKSIGNTEPMIASRVLNSRLKSLLQTYGSGEPINYVDASNGQLTTKSEAVIQFEATYQPFDNVLSGIPEWALNSSNKAPKDQWNYAEVQSNTKAALSELTQSLVSWDPKHLWLRFRRAQLLDALKHYWSKCEDDVASSTLLTCIDSLLRYLGLGDEWNPRDNGEVSGETVGLKKKSGVTLVSISKQVPYRLVPWLTELSDATSKLLLSDGLIPMNQMHLYEFLTCVATVVDDPIARSNFVGNVLSNAVETLESPNVQHRISSTSSLLSMVGVSLAAENPGMLTDPSTVRNATEQYNQIFAAFNRLLSVGRRCNEASRKTTVNSGLPLPYLDQETTMNPIDYQNFSDEGPLSLQQLALSDPFTPLWPRIIPALLMVYESTLAVWRPENQAFLLQNNFQRYVYAISDDEAYLSKTHDKSDGGVFGEGGTAGSVVSGISRRDTNLVPKWSGWFNELRNTCFQLFGLLATERVLFAPEIAHFYPRIVSALTDPSNLKSMEHRHFTQFLKHIVELFVISCPSSMYLTHLEPILGPIFEHIRFRLEKTWSPIIQGTEMMYQNQPSILSAKALTSSDASKAASLAMRGGDEWYSWYYGHAGLFVGDLDAVTAEAAVEKHRVDICRTFSDVLQTILALKGDWALVLANKAREDQAVKRNDPSTLVQGPRNRFNDEGVELNADGTQKSKHQAAIDARKLRRINGVCHFLLLESERIAGSLCLAVIQCLGYPDAYTCRRVTKICHRILETVAWSPQYSQLIGQHMFTQAVKNVVTEPKWMVGIEWDMINVIRDIYCRLVLGQYLQFGGQGAASQQNYSGDATTQYEQTVYVDKPLQGGGILTITCTYPRQILCSLPGIDISMVEQFDQQMKQKRSAKAQKDIIRDLLRQSADYLKGKMPTTSSSSAAGGLFDRAIEEESLLHSNKRSDSVPPLPETLVTRSQVQKGIDKCSQSEPEGLAAFQL